VRHVLQPKQELSARIVGPLGHFGVEQAQPFLAVAAQVVSGKFVLRREAAIKARLGDAGAGDDCFAVWPTVSDQGFSEETPRPGNNLIRRCTGELPFLANGGALYGGHGNRIEDCLFRDISAGCGILISTTFPTSNPDGTIDNNFSGLTTVQNCRLLRCGGYDHGWTWRGAFELCVDRRSICGVRINHVRIDDSISDGLRVVETNVRPEMRALFDTRLKDVSVTTVGLGKSGSHGLTVTSTTQGGLTLVHCALADIQNSATQFRIARR
jgi:hypothetical protein